MGFIDTHAGDRAVEFYWLVEIDFPTPLYYTSAQVPIGYNGRLWTPQAFRISGITSAADAAPGITLQIENADNFIGAILFAGGDVTDTVVKIWRAWLPLNTITANVAEVVSRGVYRIDQPSMQRGDDGQSSATLTLGLFDMSTKLLPNKTWNEILRV